MNTRFAGFKNLSAGMMYWVVIAVLILLAIWLILSGLGNCTSVGSGEIKLPNVDKAKFQVLITANGRILYTDDYDEQTEDVYVLHGYYELKDNKYRWHEADLKIDVYYYGDIIITKR